MNGAFDLTPFLVGGAAARPDSLTGMDPRFGSALGAMFAAAPPDIQAQLRLSSGYRSPEKQAQLWAEALKKYGSPEAARKWVAPPGKSQHNHGTASDLQYGSDAAREWAHANAAQFGLAFPLQNENWHVELAGARGGEQPQLSYGMPSPSAGQPLGLAAMFAPMPFDMGVPVMPAAPNPAQQIQQRQQDRQEEDRQRRLALFGGGVAGLF